MNFDSLLMLAARGGAIPSKEGPSVNAKCRSCKHARSVMGSSHHLECMQPDLKVTGSPRGIRKGWFIYPVDFDPIWMTTECSNYENNVQEDSVRDT